MNQKNILFVGLALLCCFPMLVNSSVALLLGLGYVLLFGKSFEGKIDKWGGYLLKASVIGLGFGINLGVLIQAGKENIVVTSVFVFGALLIGVLIGKWLHVDKKIAFLIATGTAICGGSAIAAVGSVLKADSNQLSISTGAVFLLNAIALFVFPSLGHWLDLSQTQFGTWAAIAIHDMSSVVGTATKYGDDALKLASITKMFRVLWIIPLSIALVFGFKENRESFKIPTFIIGFLLASCLYSFFPVFQNAYHSLYLIAKQLMVVSLFFIGSSISIESLKKVGGKVIAQAILLWVIVCLFSLAYVIFVQ